MLKEFLKIVRVLSNPLLYYVDKSGNSVFRNYCLFKNTGCMYRTTIPKANAGKMLEYRFELDKILKRVYFLTPIVLYLIFIHTRFSIWSVLWFEFWWLAIVSGCRIAFSCLFSRQLVKAFGKYEVIDFRPSISKEKSDEFMSIYFSKAVALLIVLMLCFTPSFLIKTAIKRDITKAKKFSQAVSLSKLYFALYPKNEKIYDMRAYAKFRQKDYEGALEDYQTVLDFTGKKFYKEDLIRLANLLYLKRVLSTSNEALDLFNEYATKKDASVLQMSQLLWIKSIFRVEHNITEGILQDYSDLLTSLDEKDTENQFYVGCDRAYILYLMQEYQLAIDSYNPLISFAASDKEKYGEQLRTLYAERGFAKLKVGDTKGADEDFLSSGITPWDVKNYEPTYSNQVFMADFK